MSIHVNGQQPNRADTLAAVAEAITRADDAVRRAMEDHDRCMLAAESTEPGARGQAEAHRLLAGTRWTAAIGARNALEGVYRRLSAGRPSPAWEQAQSAVGDGVAPWHAGLHDRTHIHGQAGVAYLDRMAAQDDVAADPSARRAG